MFMDALSASRDLMASQATWATSRKNPSIFQRVLKARLTKRYLSARVINFSVCLGQHWRVPHEPHLQRGFCLA
jgi:hypothetical protein